MLFIRLELECYYNYIRTLLNELVEVHYILVLLTYM